MKKLLEFIKNEAITFITKSIIIFLFCFLFLVIALNYTEKFLANVDLNSILLNSKDDIFKFIKSDEVKNLIFNILQSLN